MELREKLSDICDAEIQSDSPSCYVLADAIIAALPDMVPDLVWEELRNNRWGHKSHKYQIAWSEDDYFRVRLDGKVICRTIKGFKRTAEWANAHNRAQAVKPFGIKPEAN